MIYYNENDPQAVAWLHCLMAEGAIPQGVIDSRSILDVKPIELREYTQCHFFSGIGGWPQALKLAGWPNDRPIWTGSCPCQPFSIGGDKIGYLDKRHLWPCWFHLIENNCPPVLFGEQVEDAVAHGWSDLVSNDLEGLGYSTVFTSLPAASIRAYHQRQRLYFVAHSGTKSLQGFEHIRESLPISSERQVHSQRSNSSIHPGFFDCSAPESIRPTHGLSRPVGIVRGFGNAIVPQVAAKFIQAYMEVTA